MDGLNSIGVMESTVAVLRRSYSQTITTPPARSVTLSNVNSKWESRELNDCTVFALSRAADISYEEAYEFASRAGRKPMCGFKSEDLINFMQAEGLNIERKFFGRMSVSTFKRENPVGRFFLRYKGHAFSIVDGVVYNLSPELERKFVLRAWKFN